MRHLHSDAESEGTLGTTIAEDRKATLQAMHTDAVIRASNSLERNAVLDDRPPPMNNTA